MARLRQAAIAIDRLYAIYSMHVLYVYIICIIFYSILCSLYAMHILFSLYQMNYIVYNTPIILHTTLLPSWSVLIYAQCFNNISSCTFVYAFCFKHIFYILYI